MTSPLNNTILIPTHDSLVSGKPLPANPVAEELSHVQQAKWNPDLKNIEEVYIKVNGGAAQKVILVQSLSGFVMTRENEQRKVGDYVVNLPGPVSYSDIIIRHVFTREKFFLDWLTNSTAQRGVSRADVEIHINLKDGSNQKMVFTLQDAFPIKWELQDALQSEVGAGEGVPLLYEEITLAFSKVTFAMKSGA